MKKIFIGILVGGVALAGSAFTNTNSSFGDTYGNVTSSSPQYIKLVNTYNPLLCVTNPIAPMCSYTVTVAGASTVVANTYTIAQLEVFANASPAKVIRSSDHGLYLGN